MTTLVLTSRQRLYSRVGFYLAVLLMLWAMGRLDASRTLSTSHWTDEELGVARPYIASPVWPESAIRSLGR